MIIIIKGRIILPVGIFLIFKLLFKLFFSPTRQQLYLLYLQFFYQLYSYLASSISFPSSRSTIWSTKDTSLRFGSCDGLLPSWLTNPFGIFSKIIWKPNLASCLLFNLQFANHFFHSTTWLVIATTITKATICICWFGLLILLLLHLHKFNNLQLLFFTF